MFSNLKRQKPAVDRDEIFDNSVKKNKLSNNVNEQLFSLVSIISTAVNNICMNQKILIKTLFLVFI